LTQEYSLEVVVPYGRAGASSRVRVFDWIDHLGLRADERCYLGAASNGLGTLVSHPRAVLRAEIDLRRASESRVPRLISREASPLSRGGLEARLLASAAHGVYDFDDALFFDHGKGLRRALAKPAKTRAAVERADCVIAGNSYLAEWASSLNRSVCVIPSCVEPDRYMAKQSWELADRPRLVWVGSPTTEPFLQQCADALLAIARRYDARLTVVSSGNRPLAELDAISDRVEWSQTTVADELNRADIAIAPLTNTPYTRGKCAYKVLQYAATALPFVASPVGPNVSVAERCRGVLADTPVEWMDALSYLLDQPREREQRGRAARSGVQDHYAYAVWADRWQAAVGLR
jgi:glycosyltransferase involved in cell wall biosynthesis